MVVMPERGNDVSKMSGYAVANPTYIFIVPTLRVVTHPATLRRCVL